MCYEMLMVREQKCFLRGLCHDPLSIYTILWSLFLSILAVNRRRMRMWLTFKFGSRKASKDCGPNGIRKKGGISGSGVRDPPNPPFCQPSSPLRSSLVPQCKPPAPGTSAEGQGVCLWRDALGRSVAFSRLKFVISSEWSLRTLPRGHLKFFALWSL